MGVQHRAAGAVAFDPTLWDVHGGPIAKIRGTVPLR